MIRIMFMHFVGGQVFLAKVLASLNVQEAQLAFLAKIATVLHNPISR